MPISQPLPIGIATPVLGGTAGRMLFVDAGPALADESVFTYDSTLNEIVINDGTFTAKCGSTGIGLLANAGGTDCVMIPGRFIINKAVTGQSGYLSLFECAGVLTDPAVGTDQMPMYNIYVTLDNDNLTSKPWYGYQGTVYQTAGTGRLDLIWGARFNAWTDATGGSLITDLRGANIYPYTGGSCAIPNFYGCNVQMEDGGGVTGSVYGVAIQTNTQNSAVPYYPFYSDRGGSRFDAGTATKIPLTLRGAASQTGNLLVCENSTGTDLFTVSAGGAITFSAASLPGTLTTFTNGAGTGAGATFLNMPGSNPATGNPTKWIPIDDNGTTRHIPAW